jgi:hypothetical protein
MSYRRLIGPTIISLSALLLWLDFVFFSHYPWSPVSFLAKTWAILLKIFRPLIDPSLYFWVGEVFLPVAGILLAIALLYVSVAKATLAMRRVTPSADPAMSLRHSELPPMPEPLRGYGTQSWMMSTPKSSTVPAPQSAGNGNAIPIRKSRKNGLVKRLTASYGTIGLLFGVAVCIIVYGFLCAAFEKAIERYAYTTATSINDIAAQQFGSNNFQTLRDKVDKYAVDTAVAYIYVEDREGQIIAHTPQDLPRYLKRDFPRTAERALNGANVQYRGADVYEISQRVPGGAQGFVHVGLWRPWIEQEARRTLTPIAMAIFALLLPLVGIFARIAWAVNRPLVELIGHAERISKDDFTVELALKRSDEIGDIARSLERMRSSMHAVGTRLAQRPVDEPVE